MKSTTRHAGVCIIRIYLCLVIDLCRPDSGNLTEIKLLICWFGSCFVSRVNDKTNRQNKWLDSEVLICSRNTIDWLGNMAFHHVMSQLILLLVFCSYGMSQMYISGKSVYYRVLLKYYVIYVRFYGELEVNIWQNM